MIWLLVAFIGIPTVEMLVLIEVGGVLGSVTTVFLVFFTAIVGVMMLRQQSVSTLFSFNEKLNSGEVPAEELVSGLLLLIAGAFLLLPGFVTDTLGFVFLIPPVRQLIAKRIVEKGMLNMMTSFEKSEFYREYRDNQQFSGRVYDSETVEEEREVFEIAPAEKNESTEQKPTNSTPDSQS